jgi:hypothetical protein
VNGWADNCPIQADGMHVNNAYVCLAPFSAYADGTLSVQVKQTRGVLTAGYALVFRFDETTEDFYAFLIDGNGKWRAFKYLNGRATFFEPFTTSSAIHKGLNATNILEVQANGSHFDFFVNDVEVGQVNDTSLLSGDSGVYGNVGIDVIFANFNAVPLH